jgi:hypothetical protein
MNRDHTHYGYRWIHSVMAFLAMVGVLGVVDGCFARRQVVYQELATKAHKGPLSVAILPFHNQTGASELAPMLRESLYGHLSHRPFQDVELNRVDRALNDGAPRPAVPPELATLRDLGERLGCDAVVIGTVTEFERLYMGVYSQLSLGAEIAIYDTHDGRQLWTDRHVTRLHDGSLPLTPLGIPLSGARSGWNLRDSQIVIAVEDLARTLADRVPGPGQAAAPAAQWQFDLQVGAYLDHQRAVDQRDDLRGRGFPAAVHSETLQETIWHRVTVGPYADELEALRARRQLEAQLGTRPLIRRRPL